SGSSRTNSNSGRGASTASTTVSSTCGGRMAAGRSRGWRLEEGGSRYKLHVTRYPWGREATPSLRLETEVRWFGAVGRHAPCVQPATCNVKREANKEREPCSAKCSLSSPPAASAPWSTASPCGSRVATG